MAILIEKFRETATPQQSNVLRKLIEEYRRGVNLTKKCEEIEKPYLEQAERTRQEYGIPFGQVADLIIEQEIGPEAENAIEPYRKQLNDITTKLKELFREAYELGMGELGFIQRHYKEFVGEPLPSQSL